MALGNPSNSLQFDQRAGLWKELYEIADDEIVARLGCDACEHMVTLGVNGTNVYAGPGAYDQHTEAVVDLIAGTENFTIQTRGAQASIINKPCDGPCPVADEINIAVDLLNQEYGTDLII